MLTPPGYRKRLLSDLERWTESGLISRTAADAIAAEYRTDSSRAILTVLAFVLAILAAAGVIALVAANWNAIPREIRLISLLGLNLAALGACLAFSLRRKPGAIELAGLRARHYVRRRRDRAGRAQHRLPVARRGGAIHLSRGERR